VLANLDPIALLSKYLKEYFYLLDFPKISHSGKFGFEIVGGKTGFQPNILAFAQSILRRS
jgi:hypothetical protein